MADLATIAIRADTTDLARGEAALEGLTIHGVRAEKQMRSLGTGVTQASNRLSQATSVNRNFGRSIQNASFQVGDFAVQMASGQRASLALAQQLPQLLGGFGVMGAVMGAVVAIGGALIPVLGKLGGAAIDFGDALDEATSGTNFLKREVAALRGLQDDYVAAVVRGQTEVAGALLQEIGLRGKLLELKRFDQIATIENLKKAVEASKEAADQVIEEAKRAAAIIDQDVANTAFTRTAGQRAALETLQEYLEANKLITNESQRQQTELDLANLRLEEADRLIREAAGGSTLLTTGLSNAADEAGRIALSLNEAFSRQALQDSKQYGGRGGDPRTSNQQGYGEFKYEPPKAGGSKPADQFAARLETLRASLRTEREVVQEWYEEGQALLYNQRAMEILGEEGHKEALLDLERDYQEKLAQIRETGRARTLADIAGAFGDLAGLMTSENKKLFGIGKAAAIAEATVSGYQAATDAWAKGMKIGGPPVAAAFTAASLAKTGALISSIASTNIGGGGGVSAGSAGAAAEPARTSQNVAISLQGEVFNRKQVLELINSINEAVDDGANIRLA